MKSVKFYFMPTCTHCVEARFFMNLKGIPFEEINITKDQEGLARMREISGQIGVPVFDIYGRVLIGFDPRKLENLWREGGRQACREGSPEDLSNN